MSDKRYETDNLGVACYLMYKGLKYLGTRNDKGRNNKTKVFFIFDDTDSLATKYEQELITSEINKYMDIRFFLRNEIDKALKSDQGYKRSYDFVR